MSGYKHKVRCEDCNGLLCVEELRARHYNVFSNYVCPKCGESQCFYDSSEKWVSTHKWMKFSTWGTGYYVNKEGERIDETL